MEIEDLDDYLVGLLTGLTKEQVKSDSERIKSLRIEVSELDTKLEQITHDIDVLSKENTRLKTENKALLEITQKDRTEYNHLKSRYDKLIAELPLLEAQTKAYKETLIEQEASYKEYEERLVAVESRENSLLQKELTLKVKTEEMQDLERYNRLESKKIAETIALNQNLVQEIRLGGVPIHKHIQKIQKVLDKKGIKVDVLKEIQSNVV